MHVFVLTLSTNYFLFFNTAYRLVFVNALISVIRLFFALFYFH